MSDKNDDNGSNDNQIREAAPARLPEPEARPLWAEWLIQTFDAKLKALESKLTGEIKASENRLIMWAIGLIFASFTLFFAGLFGLLRLLLDWTPLIEALKAAD